jgi:predicted flap endonuclease-1-like 5' DNA nuclease
MTRQDDRTHPNRAAFPAGVSGPALRALAAAGVRSVADLAKWTESDLATLHGMGPKALNALRDALEASGRTFRSETG